MSRLSKKIVNLLLLGVVFSVFAAAFPLSQPAHADAVDGEEGIAGYADRWLRYRALVGCYSVQDVGKNSIDDIRGATWLKRTGSDFRVALGYQNPDGVVSCGDGAFVGNSLRKIGFSSHIQAFCEVTPLASRGGITSDDPDGFKNCMSGSGEFDMSGNKDDQVTSFKNAKGRVVSDSPAFPYEGTDPIKYYVGLKSLQQFCGGKRGIKYDDSMAGNVGDSKRQVVVNEINLATGELERFVYNLSRDEGDKIDNIWSLTGNELAGAKVYGEQKTCAELAQMTWQYDDAFGAFVKVYNDNNPDDAGTDGARVGDEGEGSTSSIEGCAGGALGWIVCPMIEAGQSAMLWIAEQIGGFMELQPLSFKNSDPVFTAWRNVLGLANVMLVIAFLFIIFSQATSIGLSSYGIKSLLPKVIAAAILMNLSYFIAAVMVDMSNIFGNGISGLLLSATDNPGATLGEDMENRVSAVQKVVGVGGLALGAIIALLVVGIVPALIALLVLFIVLSARVAIIVVLVMLAPLAFAAWILPNTEKYFRKWLDLFVQMLVLYPAVMALFAGAVVASTVVAAAGSDSAVQAIIALVILAAPLFAIPALIKSTSSTLAKIGELSRSKATKAWDSDARKRTTKRVGGAMANNRWAASDNKLKRRVGRTGRFVGGYNARRDFRQRNQESTAARNQEEALAGTIMDTQDRGRFGYAQRAGGDRAIAAAQSVREKRQKEETENAMSAFRAAGVYSPDDYTNIALGGTATGIDGKSTVSGRDDATRRAAMQSIIAAGDSAAMERIWKTGDRNTQTMMYEESQKQYVTTKAAGAHFVGLKPRDTAYTDTEIDQRAAQALSGLSWAKLAAQDGASVQAAARGMEAIYQQNLALNGGRFDFNRFSTDAKENGDLQNIYRQLHTAATTARQAPEIMQGAKGATRTGLATIAELQSPPPESVADTVAGTPPMDDNDNQPPIPGL